MKRESKVDSWDALEMHVQPPKSKHGVIATINFGFVKGMMLLALSEQSLRAFVDEMSVNPDRPNEEEESTSDAEAAVPGTRKRKRKSDPRRKGPITSVNRVFGIGVTGLVYFRWVGEDPESKELQVRAGVDQVKNCGYLTFGASKGVARGYLAYFLHFFGKHKVMLFLYKVSNDPKEEPLRKWSDYRSPPNAVGSNN
jgi:hypothetical protein